MANPYYDHTSYPPAGKATRSGIAAEFDAVEQGFDKMPVLASNANKPVFVNAGSTALEAKTAADALSLLGLGSAAVLAVGTSAGTVAAGDHNHASLYATIGHLHTGVYATVSHSHAIGEVSALQSSLDGKSNVGHDHAGQYAPADSVFAWEVVATGIDVASINLKATYGDGVFWVKTASYGYFGPVITRPDSNASAVQLTDAITPRASNVVQVNNGAVRNIVEVAKLKKG